MGPGLAREIVAELKAVGDPVASIQIVGYTARIPEMTELAAKSALIEVLTAMNYIIVS